MGKGNENSGIQPENKVFGTYGIFRGIATAGHALKRIYLLPGAYSSSELPAGSVLAQVESSVEMIGSITKKIFPCWLVNPGREGQ